jgi:glycosyltransferase involved in cell wall biosynthesis
MVAPQPFFENRGVPISVYLRCRSLANLDCTVDLVTFPQGNDNAPEGTSIYRIPNPLAFDHVPAGPSVRKLFLDVVLVFYLIWFLATTNKEYSCISAHEEGSFFVLPVAWLFGLPLVYDYHSSLLEITRDSSYSIFSGLMDWLESIALKASSAVVCVIPTLVDHVRGRVKHDNIFLVPDTAQEELGGDQLSRPTGINEDVKSWIDDEKITMVYTGSLAGYQTMDLFLQGMSESSALNELQFLLVGGTDEELRELQETIDALEIDSRVKLTGRVPGEAVPAYLKVADVLVAPRAECRNTPMKIYTYMWAGKPMLVSDVECHRVIFDADEVIWAEPTATGYRQALDSLPDLNLADFQRTIEGKYREQYSLDRFQERHQPFVDWLRTLDSESYGD